MNNTQCSIFGLKSIGDLIRSVGCKPNRRYAAAMRDLRKLNQAVLMEEYEVYSFSKKA